MARIDINGGMQYDDVTGYVYDAYGDPIGTADAVDWSGTTPIISTVTTDVVAQAAAGDSTAMTILQSLIDNGVKIVSGINAYQLQQINIQRAKVGQAPINTAAYGPQIGVGLNQSTTTMIMMIAAGLGIILLMKR